MTVKMITGDNCSNCTLLKAMLHMMKLSDDIELVDAYSTEGSRLIGITGARSIPVLVKDDEKQVSALHGINHTDKTFKEFIQG